MNGPLRKVSVALAIMMCALLVNLTYITVFKTSELNADPRNRRVRDAEFSQDRGAILVGNEPIAETRRGEGRFPFERHYPNGATWSSVTGWYSYDYARAELEQSWNEDLAGTSSSQALTRIIDVLSGRPARGANLSTSLNPQAQAAAIRALGSNQGAAIAMNYETGQILALVSTPTYDPNELATTDLGAQRDAWQRLIDDSKEPLKNRAVREVFPPGSTFKLVTAAAALEAGMTSETMLEAPASLQLPGSSHTMGNSTNCGGTEVTLKQALVTSCNTAFGNLGLDVGADKLQATAEAFGFNASPGIDLPSADSRYPAEIDDAQLALSSIGQFEVAATPLQMLMVTAAIANDGELMKPHVVTQVRGRDLRPLQNINPSRQSRPISANTASQLQGMMKAVVSDGTGRPAQMDGLTIGGKTGTAQSAPDRPPYAWFVGYAEEPKVAIVVFVQSADVERNDISGGRVAAPVFRAIMEELR